MVAVSLKFDEKAIPLSYKIHINNYLTAVRKTQLSAVDGKAEEDKKATALAEAKARAAHINKQDTLQEEQTASDSAE